MLNYQQLNQEKQAKQQPEQEQNHRYGDQLEGYQLGGERGRTEERVQGSRSILGRNKIDRGMLRII